MLPLAHIGFTAAAVKLTEKGLRLRNVDYRLVIVASLLPDLVDKPLSHLLVGSYTYESRAFGHSLAFLGCFCLIMLIHYLWTRKSTLFPVCLGILLHDVFDEMWLQPGVLYWPLYGWTFPRSAENVWQSMIQIWDYRIHALDLYDNLGVLILLWFFMRLALNGRLTGFIKQGKM